MHVCQVGREDSGKQAGLSALAGPAGKEGQGECCVTTTRELGNIDSTLVYLFLFVFTLIILPGGPPWRKSFSLIFGHDATQPVPGDLW